MSRIVVREQFCALEAVHLAQEIHILRCPELLSIASNNQALDSCTAPEAALDAIVGTLAGT